MLPSIGFWKNYQLDAGENWGNMTLGRNQRRGFLERGKIRKAVEMK